MTKRASYYVIVALASLAWAGSFIAVKIGVEEIPPVMLAFLRFAVAFPVMLMIALMKRAKLKVSRHDFLPILTLALTGVTLLYIFQFIGIKYTTPTSAALLINTNVIFIAVFSFAFLKELFSFMKACGILFGFLGAAFIVTGGSFPSGQSLIGDLLIVASACCWAVFSVVGKKIMSTHNILTLNLYMFGLGALLLFPFAIGDIPSTHINLTGLTVILYLGLICSIFAYSVWLIALSHLDATKAAVFLNLIPLFTLLLSYAFSISEPMTIPFLIGAIMIISGVYLTEKG